MSSTCSSPARGDVLDRHRFDTYAAWLEREGRAKARAEGRPQGFGYAPPRSPAAARQEKPFTVLEAGFTSGKLLNRKYDQTESCFASETERSDPYHFPNALNIRDRDHYQDRRRRSQNVDPTKWTPLPGDAELKAAVPDAMVKSHVMAHKGDKRNPVDHKKMEPLFNENVRPQADTLRELNVDLSCVNLPAREGGTAPSSRASGFRPRSLGADQAAASRASPATPQRVPQTPSIASGRGGLSDAEMSMIKSQSLPRTLSGPSMLGGNLGGEPTAFYGVTTRKFGFNQWDGRMRGGKLARDGWAGTFPSASIRPM